MNLVFQENHLVFHKKKKKSKYLNKIGQISLPMLNRIGIYQYWNNSWVNNFNTKVFLNKSLFIENLINFLFTERIFGFFFLKKLNFLNENSKKAFLKKLTNKTLLKKFNFTKLWFIKYNQFILISIFCFFYLRIKRQVLKKKKISFKKTTLVFWKKRKGKNSKRRFFFTKSPLAF